MLDLGVNVVATLLFIAEFYHIIGHIIILFRLRMLPRKDLVRLRPYFLIDALTVFITAFVYTGTMRWLALLQNIQHLYYFFTWNKSTYTKKVISWSSLDWTQSSNSKLRWEWDVILGTSFDVVVHMVNCYILLQFMTSVETIIALILGNVLSFVVLCNSKFAWASPTKVPGWVGRRIQPVNEKELRPPGIDVLFN
ncbi:uncharacterized protein LOC135487982 [Lineus longissimus]|uniref:uncharacterized protein LOC135487982 n=1 Tax=Lineus longissimus TaxID=88925 RepID=UPI002B4CD9E8